MKHMLDRLLLPFVTSVMLVSALGLGVLLFSSVRQGPDWTTAGWVLALWILLSFSAASVWGICFLRKRRSAERLEES